MTPLHPDGLVTPREGGWTWCGGGGEGEGRQDGEGGAAC